MPTAHAPSCRALPSGELEVSFAARAGADLHYVELSRTATARPFALVTTRSSPVLVTGLRPGVTFSVTVRSHPASERTIGWGPGWGTRSAPVECAAAAASTASHLGVSAPGSRFLRTFRVSEYAFDVDFLPNHNAASIEAMPVYLMTCGPDGNNCTPWSVAELTHRWDACQRALADLCPTQRGGAFACMRCAEANRAVVEEACGPWTSEDSLAGEGSFGVHWYCGVGWPESTAAEGPVSEYCVEYLPAPGGAGVTDGFSGYLSCNSDETDAYNNTPRDPRCMCIVLDDRLIAHETLDVLRNDCFQSGTMPWVNEPVCNCPGTDSPLPREGSQSLTHVGRAPVYLPYVGVHLEPVESYAASIPAGANYHFPARAKCAEGAPLGADGCTWRRAPLVRMLYGDDLIDVSSARALRCHVDEPGSHSTARVLRTGGLGSRLRRGHADECEPHARQPGGVRRGRARARRTRDAGCGVRGPGHRNRVKIIMARAQPRCVRGPRSAARDVAPRRDGGARRAHWPRRPSRRRQRGRFGGT